MAPKKKRNEMKHSNIICLRLSDIELELVNHAASQAKLSRSDYLRNLILDHKMAIHYEVVIDSQTIKIRIFAHLSCKRWWRKVLRWKKVLYSYVFFLTIYVFFLTLVHVKIPQKRPLRLRMGNERLRRKQLFLNISKFPMENFSGIKKKKKKSNLVIKNYIVEQTVN